MVRHLRFGGQARDAISGNAPRRRKRLSRVTEWLAVPAQQMPVARVIEADRVNVHLAASSVSQYEVTDEVLVDLRKPVGRQHFPHP
jgi:hypothetical protein